MPLDTVMSAADLVALGWSVEGVDLWLGERSEATVAELLDEDSVDVADRIALAISQMTERKRRRFARDCIERAVTAEASRGRAPHAKVRDVLDRATDATATREERRAAAEAAQSSPEEAARLVIPDGELVTMGARKGCARSAARTTARGALAALSGDAVTAALEALGAIAAQAAEAVATDDADSWSDENAEIMSRAGVEVWGAERDWQLTRAVRALRGSGSIEG